MARIARDTGYVAAGGIAAGATAAAVIALFGLQAGTRAWYGFHPARPVRLQAEGLFTGNLRVALLGFAAAALVASWRPARFPLDAVLGLLLAINAALVGAALAAYGQVLLTRIGAHAALELAAAAVAGGAYLDARRSQRFALRRQAWCAAIAAVLLAAGAVLEAHGH
jgi:hypothetical protein